MQLAGIGYMNHLLYLFNFTKQPTIINTTTIIQ